MPRPFYELLVNATNGDYIDGGWVPYSKRTPEQKQATSRIIGEMPTFEITGTQDVGEEADKVVLSDFAKKVNDGKHFRTLYQQTGSCVGNGGGHAIWYLSAYERIRLGQNELPKLPFYLLPYGRSRYYAGMRGRGDGSYGSAFAKAARVDGILAADESGLPPYSDQGGITWGSSQEYAWSDGARISSSWLEKSKKHTVVTTALMRSSDDVRKAIQNGYPVTIASNWGGQMRPAAKGSPAVLLNRRVTTWNHQMVIIGVWKHPTLGWIFLILNSWGVSAHGTPADDTPHGSFWVTEDEVAYIVRQEDSFAFSQFNGFPAQSPNYYLL